MTSDAVAAILDQIDVGSPIVVQNLMMFPLIARDGVDDSHTVDYLTLDEAIAKGLTEITEVSESGRVPELRVVNRGKHPTLIVDGEELLGAKQNRVVNLTILVPAESELTIPVSCVEAGRWRARSRAFTAAPRTQYATGRAKRMAQVTRSIVGRGDRTADQAEVWSDIAAMCLRMDSSSSTAAMEQIFTDHAPMVETYVSGLTPIPGQRGAVFAIDERIVGFDLFDRVSTFRKLLPKLVRSYAIDAIDKALGVQVEPPILPRERLVAGYLAAVAAAPRQRAKAVGLGDDVRVAGNGLLAAALVVDECVVHLSGFTS
jgi:ARG/rhodanese/phosphatase superfamily protein